MGVIFGSALIGSLASIFGLKKLEKHKTEEVLLKFKDRKIYGVSSRANFFGQESLGVAQIRGNGVLVLTQDELFFQMWVPKKDLTINLKNITKVEIVKSFLGKTRFKPLLKIVFKNSQDESDSAAWFVNNLTDWQASVKKIIGSNA